MPAPLFASMAGKMAFANRDKIMDGISDIKKKVETQKTKATKGYEKAKEQMSSMSMPNISNSLPSMPNLSNPLPSMSMSNPMEALSMSNPMGGIASKLFEIDPFTLIISIVVSFIMYMTHQWSYWLKICLGLLMFGATIYLTIVIQPFKPSNLPFYVLFLYIFIDYLELNKSNKNNNSKKSKKGKKKKK